MLDSLSSEMLPQKMHVERFASSHGITVEKTLEHLEVLADELELNVSGDKSVLSPGLVLRLRPTTRKFGSGRCEKIMGPKGPIIR